MAVLSPSSEARVRLKRFIELIGVQEGRTFETIQALHVHLWSHSNGQVTFREQVTHVITRLNMGMRVRNGKDETFIANKLTGRLKMSNGTLLYEKESLVLSFDPMSG